MTSRSKTTANRTSAKRAVAKPPAEKASKAIKAVKAKTAVPAKTSTAANKKSSNSKANLQPSKAAASKPTNARKTSANPKTKASFAAAVPPPAKKPTASKRKTPAKTSEVSPTKANAIKTAAKPAAKKPIASKNTATKATGRTKAATATKPEPKPPEIETRKLDTNIKVTEPRPKTASKKPTKRIVAPPAKPDSPPTDQSVVEKLKDLQQKREQRKDLSKQQDSRPSLVHRDPLAIAPREEGKDRLILLVRDPYWLHASWDVTRRSVERAKASLAGNWHTVKPVLRLVRLDNSSTTNNAESIVRDIPIHSGVRNWYVEIADAPSSYMAILGYLGTDARFHELCRSNNVRTPAPASNDAIDEHWADIARDADRIFSLSGGYESGPNSEVLKSMFEDRLERPIGGPSAAEFGGGADGSLKRHRDFHFELDVELVVYGATQPYSKLVIANEATPVRSDGTFAARLPMPNTRQVITATARGRDGIEEQTIVIAVERNTKIMELVSNTEADE